MLDLLTVKFLLSYSTRPLQIFGLIGVVHGPARRGDLAAGWPIERLTRRGRRSANRPLLLLGILLIFTGVQLVTLGLLAEMQARTYHESQNKPTYVIREIRESLCGGRPAVRDVSLSGRKAASIVGVRVRFRHALWMAVVCAAACAERRPAQPDPVSPIPDPPKITCPAPLTAQSRDGLTLPVTYPEAAVVGGAAPVSTQCAPASAESFPLGSTVVTCTATDAQQPNRCLHVHRHRAAAATNQRHPFRGVRRQHERRRARVCAIRGWGCRTGGRVCLQAQDPSGGAIHRCRPSASPTKAWAANG